MQDKESTALVWLRRDLRAQDNPALAYALANHDSVICAFVDELTSCADASQLALVDALSTCNRALGDKLWFLQGDAESLLPRLAADYAIDAVYWNRLYEPQTIARDSRLKALLGSRGKQVRSFNAAMLSEPWELLKSDRTPYRVFTAYYKAVLRQGLHRREPPIVVRETDLDRLCIPGDQYRFCQKSGDAPWQLRLAGQLLEQASVELKLASFISNSLNGYAARRDFPALEDATSGLSVALHFGQLGPRQILAALADRAGSDAFVRQLLWREFATYVLYHWPDTADSPMDERFDGFPYQTDTDVLKAWQCGQTGVPMVDAAMRQLWATGTMHNRLRMVVASYLCKHLLLDWRLGAAWFMHTLFDADLANNTMGWQWCAGCGVDAAPYFRILNPLTQGKRFDPEGRYVRRWVPELAALPDRWVHAPWEAPKEVLDASGMCLGKTYPHPLIDLSVGRQRALSAWEQCRSR